MTDVEEKVSKAAQNGWKPFGYNLVSVREILVPVIFPPVTLLEVDEYDDKHDKKTVEYACPTDTVMSEIADYLC